MDKKITKYAPLVIIGFVLFLLAKKNTKEKFSNSSKKLLEHKTIKTTKKSNYRNSKHRNSKRKLIKRKLIKRKFIKTVCIKFNIVKVIIGIVVTIIIFALAGLLLY